MIVGLTGGIGSGKTIVSKVFSLLGAAVFFSDDAARTAYRREDIALRVKTLLGDKAYSAPGIINREYISQRVFSDPALLKGLNQIIHPAVGEYFSEFISQHQGQIIIKESALLFEAGIAAGCDKIIVVAAGDELRIQRVMQRDGISREAVLHKMQSQMPQEEKIALAHHVIWNDESRLIIPLIVELYNEFKNAAS